MQEERKNGTSFTTQRKILFNIVYTLLSYGFLCLTYFLTIICFEFFHRFLCHSH
jgi:hypothetical protein